MKLFLKKKKRFVRRRNRRNSRKAYMFICDDFFKNRLGVVALGLWERYIIYLFIIKIKRGIHLAETSFLLTLLFQFHCYLFLCLALCLPFTLAFCFLLKYFSLLLLLGKSTIFLPLFMGPLTKIISNGKCWKNSTIFVW